MSEEHALPNMPQLRAYLQFHGWTHHAPGQAGTLWHKEETRLGVPFEADDVLMRGIVDRLARFVGQPPQVMARAIRYLLFDVAYLRAANDYRITDTIPLDAAARIISSGRMMLRAAATTARYERAQIGGSYSKLGDDVVRESRMGHTERGSFIIPVLVPLPAPSSPDEHEPHLFDDHTSTGVHRSLPEPFERRVVRTFAQSMQAVHDIIIEPGTDPSTDQIHELVYRGVSREFCSALAGVLDEQAVAIFETRIDWAPAVSPPTTMPRNVSIDSESVDLVKRVADKLRQQKVVPRQVFSGTIVQLRHEQDDPFAEIAIATIRRGRPAEIRVRLTLEQYRQAWEWHSAGRAVLVEGTARRTPGKPSIVDQPIRCHPVDEMLLEGTDNQTG
jgi:hypothetical protein